MSTTPQFTGTQVNYYFVCQRKLWLFSHHLQMEQESEAVQLGKVVHDTSYDREHKEIDLGPIKLDWCDVRDGVLHEVKKDDAMEEAHEWQVLYYLYYLKSKGVSLQEVASDAGAQPTPDASASDALRWKGEIDYPKLKKRVEVFLTPDKERELEQVLQQIARIVALPQPPPVTVAFRLCKKCSYCELCYA